MPPKKKIVKKPVVAAISSPEKDSASEGEDNFAAAPVLEQNASDESNLSLNRVDVPDVHEDDLPDEDSLGQSPVLKARSSRKRTKEEKVNVSIFDGSGVGTSGSLHKKVQVQKNGFRDVLTLVCKAIEENDDKKGSSMQAIRNWMKVHYDTVSENRLKTGLKKAIEKGLESGVLIRPKSSAESHGMSGRFKVDKIKLAETKKKGKPKKPARNEEEPIAQKSTAKQTKPKDNKGKAKDEDKSKEKKIAAKKELATKKPLPKKTVKELTEKLSEIDLNKKDSISSRGKSKKQTAKSAERETKESKENETGRVKQTRRNAK